MLYEGSYNFNIITLTLGNCTWPLCGHYVVLMVRGSCSLENMRYFRFARRPQSSVRGQYYSCKDTLRYLQWAFGELAQSQNLKKIVWDQHDIWLRGVIMKNRKAAKAWDQLEIPLYSHFRNLCTYCLHGTEKPGHNDLWCSSSFERGLSGILPWSPCLLG